MLFLDRESVCVGACCALALIGVLVAASPSLAQPAADERTAAANLQKLAIEVRELDRCMAIVSVEDISAFEPLTRTYYRKADELAKAIDDHAARFAARRSKHETALSFKYRVWESTLRAGSERARLPPALNRQVCTALASAR